MRHGGGEDHHSTAFGGAGDDLLDDHRRGTMAAHHAVEIVFGKYPAAARQQLREVVTLDAGIDPRGRRQIALLDHQPQRLLEHAILEEALGLAAHHTVVMTMIDEALAQPVRGGGQPQHLEPRIRAAQMIDDLAIAGIVGGRDAVAFVDHQQREAHIGGGHALVGEGLEIAHHRLHRTEYHLAGGLLAPQPGAEDVRLEPIGLVLGVVLLDQLAHMRQHQHAATSQPRQLGDHQRLAAAGGQHHHRRVMALTEVLDHSRHRLLLIGAQRRRRSRRSDREARE